MQSIPDNRTRQQSILSTKSTGIVNSRDTDIYFDINSPVVNIDHTAPKFTVGTTTGQTQQSTGTGDLDFPHLLSEFTIKGHLVSGFRHTLVGVGPICDADYTVTFTREAAIVRDKQSTPVLTG